MGEVDRLTRVNELLKRELADGLEKSLLVAKAFSLSQTACHFCSTSLWL